MVLTSRYLLTEISTVQILIKELISKFSGLYLFCFMRVIHYKVFLVAWGSRRTWAGRQWSNASRWWDNCHKHALFVQLAQTRLSFDIWLVLSRGTAAGCRKESAGKTVAVSADGSACCTCSRAFGDFGLFLHFGLSLILVSFSTMIGEWTMKRHFIFHHLFHGEFWLPIQIP